MKRKLILLLSSLLLLFSCQKQEVQIESTWNALSFTESHSANYYDYMNEPHVNITFPSKIESKSIIYEHGIWQENKNTYVFVAHNWADKEIILHIYKDDKPFKELVLKPESSTNNSSEVTLKDFSVNFVPSPGDYSFEVSVKDIRGITLLNQYCLHGTINKLIVR